MNVWRATYKYSIRALGGSESKTRSGLFLTASGDRSLYDLEKAIGSAIGPLCTFPALVSVEWLGLSENMP